MNDKILSYAKKNNFEIKKAVKGILIFITKENINKFEKYLKKLKYDYNYKNYRYNWDYSEKIFHFSEITI